MRRRGFVSISDHREQRSCGGPVKRDGCPHLAQQIARAHQAAHDLGCEVWLKLRSLNETAEGVSNPAR